MSILIGGIAGASGRLSGGLAAVNPVMVSDVQPTALQVRPKSLGPSAGKFRRAIIDTTVDGTGAPLGAVTVKVLRTADDVKVDQVISDAGGNYEASVYEDGPFRADAYLVGAPDRAGTTVNTLKGV
jgi:hypothetical protein